MRSVSIVILFTVSFYTQFVISTAVIFAVGTCQYVTVVSTSHSLSVGKVLDGNNSALLS